jgi:hypothetical protein
MFMLTKIINFLVVGLGMLLTMPVLFLPGLQ